MLGDTASGNLAKVHDFLSKISDRPKVFVFDLDSTLWSSMDAARTQPPYRRNGENNVFDGHGVQIKIHSDTSDVFQAIRSCDGHVAVASLNAKEANCISILRECKDVPRNFVALLICYLKECRSVSTRVVHRYSLFAIPFIPVHVVNEKGIHALFCGALL
jgi:hypothetical protein